MTSPASRGCNVDRLQTSGSSSKFGKPRPSHLATNANVWVPKYARSHSGPA
eukprot:CAMPEP_0177348790 /NCGR_PEP_ID=MMETSP0368-20130122/30453_1 /TAXON_ID=447022 ORGANISM="Scrippsiella hangoei-like, Strain SHHI-4" /NCGR_SAMPLE_ID=MMETSP0368 /ASSEMBLY_ACC=CAM_ASM_000363 /LENGTH=50 /DNA_ID=CAMNT_0018810625 /DNA_START=261 /DNA_END=410 /DNA_ORIENTATION=+